MKLSIKQLESGQWAAFTGTSYFNATVSDTERDARIKRLEQIGRDAQQKIDDVDNELRKLGALDESDPHGYLC